MSDCGLGALLEQFDRDIRRIFAGENRRVSQSVKTKVRKRAKGRCEYPRCKKRPREFHHWRDPATERTTAFLCHKHHIERGHTWKTVIDINGTQRPVMVCRRRVPIPKKTRPKSTKARRRHKQKRC